MSKSKQSAVRSLVLSLSQTVSHCHSLTCANLTSLRSPTGLPCALTRLRFVFSIGFTALSHSRRVVHSALFRSPAQSFCCVALPFAFVELSTMYSQSILLHSHQTYVLFDCHSASLCSLTFCLGSIALSLVEPTPALNCTKLSSSLSE